MTTTKAPDVMLAKRAKPFWILPLAASALLMTAPWIGVDPVWVRQLALISIYALVVCGVNLSFGYAGELALGHVAMFAAGAYTAGILAKHGWDASLTLPAAALAAALVGCASGIPGLRLGGWGLAMASFFVVILVPDVADVLKSQTGGLIGLQAIPVVELFGNPLSRNQSYLMITAVLSLAMLLFRNLVTSRHGGALRVLRQSPILASSLGINVYRLKMTAYVVGAVPAGLAGGLFAYFDRFIAPDFFGFELAIALIAASVLGGSESIYGAFFGAALLQLGPMRSSSFQQYALVAYGAFLVFGGVFLAGGLAGLLGQMGRRFRTRRPVVAPARDSSSVQLAMESVPGEVLEVRDVTMEFGGVVALGGVSITARPGSITGLIGPNGCGKTTLLNIISGFYSPTSGSVALAGQEIQGRPAHRVAVRGVARTFQTPLIPRSMSTLDVIATARYARDYVGLVPAMLRLPSFRRRRSSDEHEAREVLRILDIGHLANVPAVSLPLGSRRLVEVARALAAKPALLLLDEPAAGLDEAEVDRLAAAIRMARDAGATVVLVEHNFQMVCDVADHIYVLDLGKLIAEGSPGEIQENEAVSRSYIGELPDTGADAVSGVLASGGNETIPPRGDE